VCAHVCVCVPVSACVCAIPLSLHLLLIFCLSLCMQLFLEQAKACFAKHDPEGTDEVSAWEIKVFLSVIMSRLRHLLSSN